MMFSGETLYIISCVSAVSSFGYALYYKLCKPRRDFQIKAGEDDPYDVDEEYNPNEENIDIKLRLTKSLKTICKQLHIKLTYYDTLDNCNGRIYYFKNRIVILKKLKNQPLTLAHELGHYMAYKQWNDMSELSADREALKLCNSILTQEEQKRLGNYLITYFSRYEPK